MLIKIKLILLILPLLSFTACASLDRMNEDIDTLKSDVADLKKENQSFTDVRKQLAELSAQVDDLQNNLRRVDENQCSANKSLNEIRARIGSLEKNKPVCVSSSPPTTPLDPEKIYNDACRIFKEGRYPESEIAFSNFIEQFPQSKLAGDAQYWIGETYFKEGKTIEAIFAFDDAVSKYPQGNKVPEALVKQGICFKLLGEKDNARFILQQVIDKYPNTPQSDKARNELKNLSK
ncbi:MAG: tol-pal system protein YbgF [Thermodesulfobacteriota bacterium]|jgi:tol-pal system protein YbgF|nr:MAG: tol-pal system protein YbgF [Thermodesulfobacteriota bacterium]